MKRSADRAENKKCILNFPVPNKVGAVMRLFPQLRHLQHVLSRGSLICNKRQAHVAGFLVLETKTDPPQGTAELSQDGGTSGKACVRKGKMLPGHER